MSSIDFFCNLAEPTTPLPHFWEHTVGSDHAPMALRADWRQQLKRSHDELGFQYVRFHGLLSDDMGTLVREKNKLLYSFFNADQVFDFLLSIGMKPVRRVELHADGARIQATRLFSITKRMSRRLGITNNGRLSFTNLSHTGLNVMA